MPYKSLSRIAKLCYRSALFGGVALISCARIQAPPGGPEDKAPPKVISITPKRNALNVPLDEQIVIRWDEYIRPTTDAAVIFPSSEGVSVKIKGKRILIDHKELLEPNMTYRIALSSRISDYRGNRLTRPESFAFSTGDYIDTLEIKGRVFTPRLEPASDMRVEAYKSVDPVHEDVDFDYNIFNPQKILFNDSPIAVVWTGEDGRFVLRNLPNGLYLIRAFRDINGNALPNHGEDFAIAHPVPAGEDLWFAMISTTIDTVPPSLLAMTAENRFVLRCRFSDDIRLSSESRVVFEGGEDAMLLPDNESSQSAFIMFPMGFPPREFSFIITGVEDQQGNKLVDTLGKLEIPEFLPDTLPVQVLYNKEKLLPNQILRVKLNKPIVSGEIIVEDSSGRRIAGETTVEPPYWLIFEPDENWPFSGGLNWRISCFFADSTQFSDTVQYRIEVRDRATLGNLEVTHQLMHESFIVLALPSSDEAPPIILTKNNGIFFSEFVPEGDYRIFGFWDINGDSSHTPGSLLPLEYSEPALFPGDTVRVRGLWTTEYQLGTIN